MEPEQTAPIGTVLSGSTLFVIDISSYHNRIFDRGFLKHFSRREKQMTFVVIGTLRVNDKT